MKKLLSVLCLAFLCLSVYAESDKFIESLRNCSPYTDSGVVNASGIDAKSYKKMEGWKNDKCVYKETILFGDNKITTTCGFTKNQIKEITSVADAYYLTLQYTDEEIDTSSVNAVKNNPVFRVMNKYLQDPNVCSMQGL